MGQWRGRGEEGKFREKISGHSFANRIGNTRGIKQFQGFGLILDKTNSLKMIRKAGGGGKREKVEN